MKFATMRKTFFIPLVIALLSVGIVRAEDGVMNVKLKSRVSLNVETVRLGDLVDAEATDLDFVKRYGAVKIETADEADAIDHSTVIAALIGSGADLDGIRFLGNAGIALERGQKIELPQTVAAATATLLNSAYGVPGADLTVKSARILPKLSGDDMAGFKFSGLKADDVSDLSRSRFSVVIENDAGERSTHALFLNLSVETAVVTAASDLEAGQTLVETDYVSGRAPLKGLSGKIITANELNGKPFRVLGNVRKDETLTADSVGEIQQIKKGSPVTLSYKTGMLRIQATGTLASDAEIGATVQVENADSKRLVTGRLIAKDEVEVGYAN
jgi:flagella basal body P-ring formation protein FlgA